MSLTISPARIVEESDSPLLVAPEGWPRHPLGEVAEIFNGFAFKSKQFVSDGGVPLIRIRDIFNTETAVGYLGDYDQRYLVRKGELLVVMDGDFNCARWAGPDALLNQRVCKIAPDPDVLDLDYLTTVLPGYLQAIHDLTSSTTVTHLSSRDVAQIPLPVPSLAEQRALAAATGAAASSASSAISHLSTARRAIERFRQAVLAAACSGRLTADWRDAHPQAVATVPTVTPSRKRRSAEAEPLDLEVPELPETYVLTTIGAAAVILEYGTSKKADNDATGVPVLRMGNIQDGRLALNDLKYCTTDREIERLIFQDGDLLFNRTNSLELVGKAAVFHEPERMTLASYLIRVRFAPEVADPDFVNYWINSAWGRSWAHHVKTDGVSQSNINGTKLGAMPLPLPPIAEQREIVRRSETLLDKANRLTTAIAAASKRIDRSSQAVLAKAFRGELIGAASAV